MVALRLGLPSMANDDDLRPLLVSWSVALAAAAAWLLVVHLTPAPLVAPPAIESDPGPFVSLDPEFGDRRAPVTRAPSSPVPGVAIVRHTASGIASVAGIFASGLARRALDEVTRAIPGVQAVRANVGANVSPGGKAALVSGTDADTPGRAVLGDPNGAAAAGFGQVRQHAGVDRSDFHARPLAIVSAPVVDGQVADATELGTFVRGRVAQLQSCYELAGGTDLAGIVALRITVGVGGVVQSAEIVRRSWSGPAADATEACLVRLARAWHLRSSDAGATVTFPISFTRGT